MIQHKSSQASQVKSSQVKSSSLYL